MPSKTTTADTMKAAASMLGVGENYVQYAKDKGCKAFNHGRVDTAALKRWLGEHRDELGTLSSVTKEQADIRLKLLKFDRETFNFDVDKQKYWPKAELGEALTMLARHRRATLQRKLETELPPKLLGLGVIEMTEIMKRTVDEICNEWSDRTKQWTGTQ